MKKLRYGGKKSLPSFTERKGPDFRAGILWPHAHLSLVYEPGRVKGRGWECLSVAVSYCLEVECRTVIVQPPEEHEAELVCKASRECPWSLVLGPVPAWPGLWTRCGPDGATPGLSMEQGGPLSAGSKSSECTNEGRMCLTKFSLR